MERRAQLVSQVDDILRGIEALQIPAFDAFSPASGRLFVPKQALRSYLTPNKIETLHRSCRRPTSHSEKVRNYYLAVFAILFEIGKGKYILHFIPYDGFADEFLPFDEFTKKKWPHDCRKFFDKFYDTQWEFCAQQLKAGRLENKRMDPKRIIPIIAKVCLKGGPNANILKIKVHPDYNELVSKVSLPKSIETLRH
jgi:hypothetical protein